MRNYRIVKGEKGWDIQRRLPAHIESLMNNKVVYDVVATAIEDYQEAKIRGQKLAYSELQIGDVAEEF
jgi:hypothetical protein